MAEEVTRLLEAAHRGDGDALTRVAAMMYDELRALASDILRNERPNQTIRTTALVNEAFVRLAGRNNVHWENRSHFMAVAARAMRSILVDYARARNAQKRGGNWQRQPLDDVIHEIEVEQIELLALDDALTRLDAIAPRKCRVVEMRYFAGLSIEQTAAALGISHGSVENDWSFARTWLRRELQGAARSTNGE